MNFSETQTGRNFFTLQLPQLIDALQEIATALQQLAAVGRLPELGRTEEETDILSDIYHCNYSPESVKRRKNDSFDEDVKRAVSALLETLSPEQRNLFLQYESAEGARGSSIACRAYRDGVRLAVQIFMAGRSSAF